MNGRSERVGARRNTEVTRLQRSHLPLYERSSSSGNTLLEAILCSSFVAGERPDPFRERVVRGEGLEKGESE